MTTKYLDIEYLRAQNSNAGQLILAGQGNTLTYTQFVTVDANGNVGIGTSTPTSTLTVNGNISLKGTDSRIIFPDGSTATTASPSYGTAGTVQFSTGSNKFSGDSTNFFWDSSNKRLGIGTSSPVTTLQIKYTAMESTSTTWSGTGQVELDSFGAALVRSAHYFVQVTDEDNSQYHTSQITVVQDGLKAYKSEYNIVTSDNRLGDFDCVISGGSLKLLFTAYQATNKTVKITRTSMTA